MSTAPKVVKVITPNPPTWTRSITTTIPKVVNVPGKGTDVSPVTLTALTETKKASTQEIPPWVEVGSFNSKVPRPMNTANPMAIRRGAESLLNNGQGARDLTDFLIFSSGGSLHILDGDALPRAGPFDGGQVHSKLLRFAPCGVGSFDFISGIFYVLDKYGSFRARTLDFGEVHAQLLGLTFSGLRGLCLGFLFLALGFSYAGGLPPVALDAPLDGLAIESTPGLRHDRGEGVGLGGGEVR